MDIRTSKYEVERLPNRVKEIWFPGVSGHSTVDMGGALFQIRQTGLMDISPQMGGIIGGTGIAMLLGIKREIMGGTELVTVDTNGQGVYQNCRLVSANTRRRSYRTVEYVLIWRQCETGDGVDFTWPD